MNKHEPTEQQRNIIRCEGDLIVVQARAGTGKTWLMAEKILRDIEHGADPDRILAISYTVSAGEALRAHLKARGVTISHCGTLHSWAMKLLGIRAEQILQEEEAHVIAKLTCLAMHLKGVAITQVLRALESPREMPGTVGLAARNVEAQIRGAEKFTFGMILKEAFRQPLNTHYDLLVVDEAQDTAPVDAEIYQRLSAKRKIFIGDPQQAIYGFRGCSPQFLKEAWRKATHVFPLSVSFRCGGGICQAANRLFPDPAMTSLEGAYGQVDIVLSDRADKAEMPEIIESMGRVIYKSRAILCRYNKDVEEMTNALRTMGWKVKGSGADKGRLALLALRTLADTSQTETWAWQYVRELGHALAQQCGLEVVPGELNMALLMEARETARKGFLLDAVARIGIDRRVAVGVLANSEPLSGDGIEKAIESILNEEAISDESNEWVTVQTIHQSKGKEYDEVFIPRCNEPGPMAKMDEEKRILYVAITRARHHVRISTSGKPSPFLSYGVWTP